MYKKKGVFDRWHLINFYTTSRENIKEKWKINCKLIGIKNKIRM